MLDQIALDAATRIEGLRDVEPAVMRKAQIQITVREALSAAATLPKARPVLVAPAATPPGLTDALHAAFVAAIHAVGFTAFKAMSWFASRDMPKRRTPGRDHHSN